MRLRAAFWTICCVFLLTPPTLADASSEQFRADYNTLVTQVHDRSGELITVDSFRYEKDVATFLFGPGTFVLQRPINGRPTVAAYVGQGRAHIDIPVAPERNNLFALTRDTVVDEEFTVCFMRMADDLDLKLKERFPVRQGRMAITDFEKVRDDKGEYYFKPTLFHAWDNLAQLLISAYERKSDGYFWASFNHTVFCFDPNRSEEVSIGHVRNPDMSMSDAIPSFQRRERARYANEQMSNLDYLLTMTRLDATLELGGADGWRIERAEINAIFQIERDSLLFPSFFMDRHLDPDSIHVNGAPVEHFRRKDFYHLLLLLPEYAHKGDTLNVRIWYSNGGSDYVALLPWVENTKPLTQSLRLVFPRNYNYALPMGSPVEECEDGRRRCTSGGFYGQHFTFRPMVTNYDTTTVDVDSQVTLQFIATEYSDVVREKEFQAGVSDAFKFFMDRFGNPSDLTEVYIFPFGNSSSPGMLHIPSFKGEELLGGFSQVVGSRVAMQWFGPTTQLASYRESWMLSALPLYLGMMYVEKNKGSTAMYSNLRQWKLEIEKVVEKQEDIPLTAGVRGDERRAVGKGIWMLHMLRILMRDLQNFSDDRFMDFLRDIIMQANHRKFSNADFCALAESHVGVKLDWFFSQWMYGRGFPVFTGSYAVVQETDGSYIDLTIATTGVPAEAAFPVLFRIQVSEGSVFARKAIAGQLQQYRLGPFTSRPVNVVFNEYESVLCDKKVK